jgi:hypothetical protein
VGPQEIILSCTTEEVEIRYTLDGTDPFDIFNNSWNSQSIIYTTPIQISDSTVISARALKEKRKKLRARLTLSK